MEAGSLMVGGVDFKVLVPVCVEWGYHLMREELCRYCVVC